MSRHLYACAGLLAVCSAAYVGIADHARRVEPSPPIAKQSAVEPAAWRGVPFSYTALDGRVVSSDSLPGKVAVLYFWKEPCRPCKTEVPFVTSLPAKFGSRVVVLGFVGDTAEGVARQAVKDYGLDGFPNVLIGRLADCPLAVSYEVAAYPSITILGKDGVSEGTGFRGKFIEDTVVRLLEK